MVSNDQTLRGLGTSSSFDKAELLAVYEACGEHMRFYARARFEIMTLAILIAGALISAQQLLPDIAVVFGVIGFVATLVLFSLEYRYSQAWVALLNWAQHHVEDTLFGEGGGPLNSYGDLPKPWYVLRARLASNLLYGLLLLIWIGNTGVHAYHVAMSAFP